jgi:hypothetical protein
MGMKTFKLFQLSSFHSEVATANNYHATWLYNNGAEVDPIIKWCLHNYNDGDYELRWGQISFKQERHLTFFLLTWG